ncbi:zinc finger MYM-type protein 1-like protein [Tanacetum coccineum]
MIGFGPINAMSLVKSVKEQLQIIRNEGWESLLASVVSFCEKNDINVPRIEDMHPPKLTRRNREPEPTTTTLHQFQVDVFYSIIDKQLQELNERFDEESMDEQLDKYIQDVKKDKRFKGLKEIKELSKKLVELVFKEASGEWLLFNTGSQLLNDRMVTYIERDVFIIVSNEDIINNFESKKTCQE